MKSFEWDVSKKMFVEVDDPVYDPEISGVSESMVKGNYFVEFSSEEEDGVGATITVYATETRTSRGFILTLWDRTPALRHWSPVTFPHWLRHCTRFILS